MSRFQQILRAFAANRINKFECFYLLVRDVSAEELKLGLPEMSAEIRTDFIQFLKTFDPTRDAINFDLPPMKKFFEITRCFEIENPFIHNMDCAVGSKVAENLVEKFSSPIELKDPNDVESKNSNDQ